MRVHQAYIQFRTIRKILSDKLQLKYIYNKVYISYEYLL